MSCNLRKNDYNEITIKVRNGICEWLSSTPKNHKTYIYATPTLWSIYILLLATMNNLSQQSQRAIENLRLIMSCNGWRMPNIRQIHNLLSELSLEHSYIENLWMIEFNMNNRRHCLWSREWLRPSACHIWSYISERI